MVAVIVVDHPVPRRRRKIAATVDVTVTAIQPRHNARHFRQLRSFRSSRCSVVFEHARIVASEAFVCLEAAQTS